MSSTSLRSRELLGPLAQLCADALRPLDERQREIAVALLADVLLPEAESAAIVRVMDDFGRDEPLDRARRLADELAETLGTLHAGHSDQESVEAAADAVGYVTLVERCLDDIDG